MTRALRLSGFFRPTFRIINAGTAVVPTTSLNGPSTVGEEGDLRESELGQERFCLVFVENGDGLDAAEHLVRVEILGGLNRITPDGPDNVRRVQAQHCFAVVDEVKESNSKSGKPMIEPRAQESLGGKG